MPLQFTTSYLTDSLSLLRMYKKLAEGAIAQVSDEQLFLQIDEESNSIAILIKHSRRQHAVAVDRLSGHRR